MPKRVEEEKRGDACVSHTDHNMAHIYVIDCGVNDSRYNFCTDDSDKNDNTEFKLRVERNKENPTETLVSGRDLEEVIRNTLIPPTTFFSSSSSSLASSTSELLRTREEPCKMQYILQFVNGRVVLPNEMFRDGDTVEVHRYLLQRELSSRNRNKATEASHDNIKENKKRKVSMSERAEQSKQREQKESSLQQHNVPYEQQSKNNKSFHSENKECDKAKSVILMSDESDDDEDEDDEDDKYSSENANASKENNRDITRITNSNCYGNDDNRESTCSNSKEMHAAKYINALRESLAAARKRVQELDDEVENEKQVLQEQLTRTSWAIKREAEEKKNALQEQLANLEREAVRIRAMQKRTRCATERILDKMKNAQTSIDHDIVLLDNEMRKMLRIWQKCVEAHLAARCKQSSKIVGKENKSKESIANERAVLEAEGVVLCRELIASIAHTYVREMRQKLEHEWSSTRTMETEEFGKTFAHEYSALPYSEHGDNVDATGEPNWPFTVDSAHIVKVIARLRAPCSELHIPQERTRPRAGIASNRHTEIQDDNNDDDDDDVIHKWRNAWADMQNSDEYEEIANEKKATIQVHVPTKGIRTFMLNAVYGPKHSNLLGRSNQSDKTASMHKCNTNNKDEEAESTIFSSVKIDNQQIQQSEKLEEECEYEPKHQQQKRIFAEQLLPLILELLFCANKHYITVIAYGAKRSGKSYTLLGSNMDMTGQYGDESEKYIEESNDGGDKVKNNSGKFYNRLREGELGVENAMQRGVTAIDANWVVNMNEKVKISTSNNKLEKTKVSAYSTAWQSAAQDAVSSREAMSTLREQVTRQLSSNTFGLRCCNWDGLLPQTLQFLLANLQSNRPHSNILEHKCQITEIGVSACVVERTGVRDLFANYAKSDNNNEHHHHHYKEQSLFIPHKAHKTSNAFNYYFPSSSSPSVKTFTTKVNKQIVSLESVNVRAVNDVTLIMNTLKSVVKCDRHEKESHNAEQTQITESKNGSYTSLKDKSHDDHNKHSTKRITKEETKNINTNESGTNDHKHLLVVVRCTLSIHDNIDYKGLQNRKLQHTETTKNLNSKENDNGKSTKEVQLFFVEVAAGIDDTNKINGHLVKSTNKIQTTRTLTSIGNILYALNHSIKEEEKYDSKHEEKETHKENLLSWHATVPDDKCNNTSLSVINKQPVCRPMDSQSIFDEDPGKWWDVLRPLHGMTFTRVAPIIQQTQLFATNNTDHCEDNNNRNSNNVTTSTSVTPDLANTLQRQKTQKCISSTRYLHTYQMRNNNNENVALNLSATQRSIILQGYANDTLTQLIRGGLTGSSRVLLIACLKPCVPCEVELVTEDAKPLTLPSPHTIKGMEQIKEIISLLYNVQAPQMSAEAISTLTFAKRIMS